MFKQKLEYEWRPIQCTNKCSGFGHTGYQRKKNGGEKVWVQKKQAKDNDGFQLVGGNKGPTSANEAIIPVHNSFNAFIKNAVEEGNDAGVKEVRKRLLEAVARL